jgi:hypothetical protein
LLGGFDPDFTDVYSMHLWGTRWTGAHRFHRLSRGPADRAFIRSEGTAHVRPNLVGTAHDDAVTPPPRASRAMWPAACRPGAKSARGRPES